MKTILYIALGLVLVAIYIFLFQFLWNWVMPDVFGIKELTYLQSAAIVFLISAVGIKK